MCHPNALFAGGMMVACISGLLFVIFASTYIGPYTYSKGFDKVTCTVQSSAISANVCCDATKTFKYMDPKNRASCDADYYYPCLVVTVTYVSSSISSTAATMYYDFESAKYQGDNPTCSYFHCPKESYSQGYDDVTSFQTDYGTVGSSYTCYRNPDDTDLVIIDNSVTFAALFNMLFWTLIFFIVGLGLAALSYMELSCWKRARDEELKAVLAKEEEEAEKREDKKSTIEITHINENSTGHHQVTASQASYATFENSSRHSLHPEREQFSPNHTDKGEYDYEKELAVAIRKSEAKLRDAGEDNTSTGSHSNV